MTSLVDRSLTLCASNRTLLEATRARIGKAAYELDVYQQCCGGLNFGYYYDASPIIAYDGERQPTYTMGTFTSSTVPGCRAPHVWLEGRRSLYDALGPDYTLLRFEPSTRVTGLVEAAASRGVPLPVLDLPRAGSRRTVSAQACAGAPGPARGVARHEEPSAPLDLIDLIRGSRA